MVGSSVASLVVLRNSCSLPSTYRTALPIAAGSVSGSYQLNFPSRLPDQRPRAIDLIV